MIPKKIAGDLSNCALVVGAIHSDAGLKAALRLKPGALDFLEIRVDAFPGREEALLRQIQKLKIPLIITIRHPSESGRPLPERAKYAISPARRRALYGQFLPHAALVDIEARFAKPMSGVIQSAKKRNTGVILSSHDFKGTPSLGKLQAIAADARKAGADIFKVAATPQNPRDIAVLLAFQASQKKPLSLMGMGKYGKVSRLLFAQGGSVLNYGFLEKANAPGQWPAVELKKRIGELR